jgi:hypothetical protein
MPVQGLKKRHRGRKSTAERRGEQKKGTRGYYESRGKVTVAGKRTSCHARVAWCKRNLMRRHGNQEYCESWRIFSACRKVFCHAAVVWRKRKLFRRTGTQEIYGRRKELAIAGIRTTHCAQVVRRKVRSHEGTSIEQGRRKYQTKNKFARGTSKSRTHRRRQRATQQGNNRTRKRNPKKHSKRTGTVIQTFGKTMGLKFSERVSRSTVGLRRIRTRTLWRDRPPPKRKKKLRTE